MRRMVRRRPRAAWPTIEEMLRRIVRRVANEWLRVYNEPRFPLRSQDVAGVQIGSQQHFDRSSTQKLAKKTRTFAHESFIRPTVNVGQGLIAPMFQHVRQRPKGWSGTGVRHSRRSSLAITTSC